MGGYGLALPARIAFGALTGGVGGALLGSVGGDFARSYMDEARRRNSFVPALLAGLLAGVLVGMKFDVIATMVMGMRLSSLL